MKEYRINFIRKSSHSGSHDQITAAGNSNFQWELPVSVIIRRIEAKYETFYVQDERTGKKAYVGVFEMSGRKYIRTYADGYWNDNLLSLPVLGTSEKSYG